MIDKDPDLLILDEPTAGQDKRSTELLGEIMNRLTEQNKTVITITHDMEFVVKEFKRVIVMAEKRKRKDASPREIFWNLELLKLSNLKQHYICRLAYALVYENIMTIQEMIEVDKNEKYSN